MFKMIIRKYAIFLPALLLLIPPAYSKDLKIRKKTGGRKIHISEISGPPEPGSPIAVADHCYTCTAGAGFT
jgi:hypothetical protein